MSNKLFNVEQIRLIEQEAIEDLGLAESELMERAGLGAFHRIKNHFARTKQWLVFCGSGNNGGDGMVVARLASLTGIAVTLFHTKEIEQLSELNQSMANLAIDAGVHVELFESDRELDMDADLIIDAVLGIGLQGLVTGLAESAVNLINDSTKESAPWPVIALDCPSGLDTETGCRLGVCVKADLTITFIGVKAGMLTADGLDYCGQIVCDDLGLEDLVSTSTSYATRLQATSLKACMPARKFNSHKRQFGHVLIIGGGVGMPGAVCLAATACLRTGAGLVSVATHPSHADMIPFYQPELMSYPIESGDDLAALLDAASVCVIGPGLGLDDWAQSLFKYAIVSHMPMVIDASALLLLADMPQHDDNWVLTPHPGEAAVLLNTDSHSIGADRYESVKQLQARYGGSVVLKGAGSLIASNDGIALCPFGNPAMSSAGMGDVLSGIIAGLIAQGLSLENAASGGVVLHALAGDQAAQGQRALLASDLLKNL